MVLTRAVVVRGVGVALRVVEVLEVAAPVAGLGAVGAAAFERAAVAGQLVEGLVAAERVAGRAGLGAVAIESCFHIAGS